MVFIGKYNSYFHFFRNLKGTIIHNWKLSIKYALFENMLAFKKMLQLIIDSDLLLYKIDLLSIFVIGCFVI